jgi:membrane-associated phospholipid phosphatase
MLFLITGVLLSGFVGFARLKLKAHEPMQIYAGYLIGFAVMLTVFLI